MQSPRLFCLLSIVALLISGLGWKACTSANQVSPPPLQRASLPDFDEAQTVSVTLAEGLQLDLWAPGPLLHNAVALSINPQGVVYVSETERRKSSDLDIRQHRDWITEELGLTTIEETEAFHKAKLDPSLSDQNTWQEDFNGDSIHDWRDLMVQSERIRRVWDSDGDGKADVSQVYAEDFRDMLAGVAAGVLVHDGEVFTTVAPDLWRLKDKNQDGLADEKTSISHGYGLHIAYAGHDMSGLVMGPDGKLYWSVGDMGANVVDQTGKRWAYPHQGAVMRCNPDGSEFEVFAHGLRNPQELAFDQYGNLISVDNDGDHPGEHERVVHILEGSDTGWRIHWQFGKYNQPGEAYKIWIDERLHVPHFEGQAAYLLPPLALAKDGPAGLAYNPGTALSEDLGGYFFSSHFTASSSNSEIVGIKLEPKGASFSVAEQNSVSRGIVSTGISFGPDGALYLADWMDSYNKKPTGRIWKLHAPENPHPLQAETQQLLAEGMQKRGLPELQTLLGHADMRVRMGAQFELVKRNAAAELENTLATDQPQLARIHAIWGLGQLVRTADHDPTAISELLGDADPEVWAQAAKVLGEIQHTASEPNLLKGLTADFPRVQYFSAEALGKIEAESAFEPLVELLEQIGDSDPHMRHGLMYALSKVADASTIANLASHPSAAVRIGAVVALRHQASAQVSQFLADQQPAVVTEAARAIHDDWGIEAALPALAGALLTSSVQEEAFLRRAINANLRLGDAASAERLATYANQSQAPAKMRAQALRSLGYWQDPPVLDRVEGRYRELTPRDPALALAASLDFFPQWLNATQPEPLVVAAAWSSGRLGSLAQAEQLMGLVKMNRASASVRAAALQALRDMDAPQKVAALELVLTSSDSELRDAAQKMLSGFHLPEKEVVNMLATVLTHGTPKEQQRAFANLGDMDHPEATQILSDWMDKLIAGAVAPAAQLDVLMAAEQNGSPQLAEKITAYEATLPSDDPLAAYRVAMYGGNPKQGGRTAYLNASAQCFRCHQVNGRGGAVGPDLTGIASVLDREQLLESLIEPSARLAPGYGTVVVKLTNGDQRVGTIVTDSDAALTIATAEGGEITLAADQIAEKTIAPSGMPSMKGMLTKAEMRDILAFLGTLTE